MRARRNSVRVLLGLVLVVVFGVSAGGSASAVTWYAGNSRSAGHGVKANISTPSSMPSVPSGVVFHYVSAVDGVDWVQVGWVQGDGVEIAPDGVPWPDDPTSYLEARVDYNWDVEIYGSQPLNYARAYEVVHTGSGTWQGIIQSTPRPSYGPMAYPTVVKAQTEIKNSTAARTRAGFGNVQYKGLYSYMLFNENNRIADNPPYASFSSNYTYTCYNGM